MQTRWCSSQHKKRPWNERFKGCLSSCLDGKVTLASREEIEALLAREFPGKIAPIRESLDKTPKGGRTHIGIGRKVVEFPRQ